MNNEERFSLYRRNKILKFLILFLSIVVVVLEIIALFGIIHYIWGLIVFGIVYLLKNIILKENKK